MRNLISKPAELLPTRMTGPAWWKSWTLLEKSGAWLVCGVERSYLEYDMTDLGILRGGGGRCPHRSITRKYY